MAKATNTKDFTKIDNMNKYPNNRNVIKTFIKENGTMRGVGSNGQEYPFATVEQKIVYGKVLLIQGLTTPSTQNSFLSINGRKAPHIVDAPNGGILRQDYKNCFWSITRHPPAGNSTTRSDLRFSTAAEVYAFVLDNAGSISGAIYQYDFTAEVYDKIDANLPTVQTIYGQNMFYSMLKGRKQYKKSLSVLDNSVERGDYDQWIQDVVRTVTPYITYNRVPGDHGNNLIRTSANHKKMYGLLNENALISAANLKRYTTDGASIIDGATSPSGEYYIDHNNSYYCGIEINGTNAQMFSKSGVASFMNYRDTHSFVVAYRAYIGGNYSVFIKPVGIDMLTLPRFDTTKYDLYSYMHARNRRPQTKKITVPYQSEVFTDAFRIPLSSRSPLGFYRDSINGYFEEMSMKFMLKDKTTGKISPLSKARVVWRSGRDRPYYADVRY